ncbi:hypothetical protein [Streptomyces sp. 7N604]|uniref:hypothetical protein n=1 Tax=Streptomyces sp. 7N604 TaxID=3457415 RepID=UPI003FCF0BEE
MAAGCEARGADGAGAEPAVGAVDGGFDLEAVLARPVQGELLSGRLGGGKALGSEGDGADAGALESEGVEGRSARVRRILELIRSEPVRLLPV